MRAPALLLALALLPSLAAGTFVHVAVQGPALYSGPLIVVGPATTFAVEAGADAVEWRVDDGPWTPYAAPFALPAVDGERRLEVRAIQDGVVTAEFARRYVVDATPPQVVMERPVAGFVYSEFPLLFEYPSDDADGFAVFYDFGPIAGAGSDAHGLAAFDVVVDGRAESASSPFRQSRAFVDGEHTVRLRAVDRLGNVGETEVVRVRQHAANALRPDVDVYAPSGPPVVRPEEACRWALPRATCAVAFG